MPHKTFPLETPLGSGVVILYVGETYGVLLVLLLFWSMPGSGSGPVVRFSLSARGNGLGPSSTTLMTTFQPLLPSMPMPACIPQTVLVSLAVRGR